MGINRPDNNIVEGFNKLWHEASIHDVENGNTSGINKEEFDGMSMFLNDAINNASASEETINWAQKKLHDLNRMKSSIFNNENIRSDAEKSSPKGLLENIKDFFTKTEKDYYEENVISYSTMLTYNGGGIEAIEEEDKKRSAFLGFEFGGVGSGSIFTSSLFKSEE